MTDTAIHAAGLSRRFGAIRAVDDLTLDVPRGIIFGFLGPNGSGKTTTIRLLLGLLAPDAGEASVLGHDVRRQSQRIREATGALLEHHGLYERLEAEANLDFYGRVARLPTAERRRRIRELLEALGLWDRRHEIVGGWSRGMKQKLAVARVMLHRPELIFLDEPTAGLDPMAASQLRQELVEMVQREGTTVFLTTHNLSEAERLCQQVGVIKEGRLLAVGPPDSLRTSADNASLRVYGRGWNETILATLRRADTVLDARTENGHLVIDLPAEAEGAHLVRLLVSEGVAIEEVHRSKPTLEEAFLALMDQPEGNVVHGGAA